MRAILILFFISCNFYCFAQQDNSTHVSKKIPRCAKYLNTSAYSISFITVGIGMPPNFINGRLHPGLNLGLQHMIKRKSNISKTDYALQAAYFSIQSLQRVAYFQPGIGHNFKVLKRLTIRPSVNYAFMLVQQINDEFKFVGNGQYEKVASNRFQMLPSVGLDAQLILGNYKQFEYSLLAGYQFGVQLPFSELSGILPLNQLKLGLSFQKK